MLVGRTAECAQIALLLEAAREQRSGTLVLSGEPGIGKSALCSWTIGRAGDMRVLEARGVESEADLPFAGLSDLCSDALDGPVELPEPQARALDVALARRTASPSDRFAIGAAVLTLLAEVGGKRPVLVVVEDAHWLDGSSADALLFAARRLRREAVVMIVATRPGGAFDGDRADLDRLALTGLDDEAAHTLLRRSYGELPDPVAAVLTERAAGNPLALLEVSRLLTHDQLQGREPIDDPLPLAPAVKHALLDRLAGLSEPSRRALLLAAASGTERVQPILNALGTRAAASDLLRPAEERGVLSLSGERFQFRHPLLRSAIYHDAPAAAQRAAHAALAGVTSGDPRAWHLAQSTVGEDEAVAALLEQAGRDARRRGAPAAAARALERAARMSDQPAARRRRFTEAAGDAYLAGRPGTALDLLDRALDGAEDPIQRADVQHLRGRILVLRGQSEAAYELLIAEAQRVRPRDPERAAGMLSEACLECLGSADIRRALTSGRWAVAAAADGGPGVRAFARSMLTSALILSGDRGEAQAGLGTIMPVLDHIDPLSQAGELITNAGHCWTWLEQHDQAGSLFERVIASARAANAPAALPWPLACRAELDFRRGRWAAARASAEEAALLGEECGQPSIAAYALDCLVRLDAVTGDETRARERAAEGLRVVDEYAAEPARVYLHGAIGLLELGAGQVTAAIEALERVAALVEHHGLNEPNVIHWHADLIEAYARAGQVDAAEAALRALAERADGTGGRWARGTAARCQGLLGRGDAERAFARSLEELGSIGMPFEVARTRLCLGELLRRTGRRTRARQVLRDAGDAFETLGAMPWLARTEHELRATGETPRRRSDPAAAERLTAHELQVALIVAGGASNREAAAALFLSPKTIEFHLGHIYRKLSIRGRTELAALAHRRGWLQGAQPMAD